MFRREEVEGDAGSWVEFQDKGGMIFFGIEDIDAIDTAQCEGFCQLCGIGDDMVGERFCGGWLCVDDIEA